MKLLFDIGNSRLKWALAETGRLVASGAENTDTITAAALDNIFSETGRPASAWVSSVGASQLLELLLSWLESRLEVDAKVVQVSARACGIQNGYDDIASLGVDRWVAAIGARSECPAGHIIIVDAGTAVTIDWLSASDVFEGGVILPGPRLMHDALVSQTAGIKSEYIDTRQIIGKTTRDCVNSGVTYGLSGAVDRIVNEIQANIGQPVQVLLTGGGADALLANTRLTARHCPDLVLNGLQRLATQTVTEEGV